MCSSTLYVSISMKNASDKQDKMPKNEVTFYNTRALDMHVLRKYHTFNLTIRDHNN